MHRRDCALEGGADGVLHFHRLEYQQCRATCNCLAWLDQYGDDLARHGCGEITRFFLGIGGIIVFVAIYFRG